tara:strand:+ start:90 stop:476 length:387 start_codon:yes stop_codon:yes gene_type:complete
VGLDLYTFYLYHHGMMINKGEDIMTQLKKIDRKIVTASYRKFSKIVSYSHVEQYEALKELIKNGQEQLELLKDIMLENNLAYREASSTSRRMMKREEAIKVLGVETVDKITKTINVQGKFVVGKRPTK